MKYKTDVAWRTGKSVYLVIGPSGATVAECKSQKMADRVAKGLILEREEAQKLKNFRL